MPRTRRSLAKDDGTEPAASPIKPVTSRENRTSSPSSSSNSRIMLYLPATVVAVIAGFLLQSKFTTAWSGDQIPAQAQFISPKSWAVLDQVAPPSLSNGTTLFYPPGTTRESLKAQPFLVYSDEFYNIIGSNPTVTLIAKTDGDPLFHEAVVWYPPTDEVFFVQNAGAAEAGTGLAKSAIIQKIALSQADAVTNQTDASGQVDVVVVDSSPQVINPNGATNYMGKIAFMGEGQGDNIAPAIYVMEPTPPYNTTVILNNYFGRQFSSLNDVAIHPRNKEMYFTDVTYGFLQDFRPAPVLPNQVYRFNPKTGLVGVVADGFDKPNGITFSPDGTYAYIADTGAQSGPKGQNFDQPATIYRFTVNQDGSWGSRQTFAFVDVGFPDGIHCDTKGYVYAGCGDGVHVWNPAGQLIGKIYLGTPSANFQFAGQGRMVICAETELYYVTLGATGAQITDYDYSQVS